MPQIVNVNLNSDTGGGSNAIYGVDGSPTVHDMYFRHPITNTEEWATILMIPYGRGGAGFSVLDITTPENPLHLYSVFNDQNSNKVHYVDHMGTFSAWDYISPIYNLAQFKEAKRIFNRTNELMEGQLASQASLDAARANMDALEALYNVRKQFVSDMKIRAPFGGVVVFKAAQPGEMVSPVSAGGGFTKTGICSIVDMDSLEVEVDVNEAFINRVVPGQPAVANLNAYPKWDIPANVIAIIPTADRNKATVKVRIGLIEKDERVLPDMGARVSFLRKVEETENQVVGQESPQPIDIIASISTSGNLST